MRRMGWMFGCVRAMVFFVFALRLIRARRRSEFVETDASFVDEQLEEIQSRLLDIGSAVATPLAGSSETMRTRASFDAAHVETLERWIDELDAELPALTNFLLVSGGKASVFLHQARVVCRRAERSCVPLIRDGAVPEVVRVYLNRLSDFFFTAARCACARSGAEERPYKKATTSTN